MADGVTARATANPDEPTIRRIGIADLRDALSHGVDDFLAIPTQLVFLCVFYPVMGLVLARAAYTSDLLPLLFPLVAGFALIGPIAALGLYELSRRREQQLPVTWLNVFDVLRSPSLLPILLLGAVLVVVFLVWLSVANAIYGATLGGMQFASLGAFLGALFDTSAGWRLILLGNAVGAVFAVAVMAMTVVAFPMLLDRPVGPVVAVQTSIRAVLANPWPMAVWGAIVGAALLVGSLPLFVGLAVVLPILGHGTWHLYRKLVAP